MGISTLPLHLLILLLLAVSIAGRPCKTLSYYTTPLVLPTYYPKNLLQYPSSFSSPNHLTLIFTTRAAQFPRRQPIISFYSNSFSDDADSSSQFPVKFYSSVSSSIGNSTMDIMSVLCGLLFGVVLGSLTAVIMLFAWSLYSRRHFDIDDFSSSDSDDDDDDEDFCAAKKMGYVAIYAKTNVVDVDDDLKKSMPPAKEEV